jgi:methionine-rich copper-binding protein CopC
LNEITLSFDQPVYYYDDVTINITDENGNVVTTAYIDYGWEYEDMMVILNQEITAPGKYTVTVPAGCLFGYGSSNAEIVLTYTVEDPTGINRLFVENKNDVYTLDGRKVVVMPGQKIKKGLYIVGGKKVYVK